jgi:hypothetical protein
LSKPGVLNQLAGTLNGGAAGANIAAPLGAVGGGALGALLAHRVGKGVTGLTTGEDE